MSVYKRLVEAENAGIRCAVCTIIDTKGTTPRKIGSKMIVYHNGNTEGSVGGGLVEQEIIQSALNAISNSKMNRQYYGIDSTYNNENDCIEVLIEPIIPNTTIVIIGAGHIGKVTAFFAKKLGWHIVVVDDRTELCNKKNIADADEFYSVINDGNKKYVIQNSFCYIFCTRSADIDLSILPMVLDIRPKYIGILGSVKRYNLTETALISKGFNKVQLEKIYAPIGIEIEAETPEEIAVSIIAQIIKINNHLN
jgi:xanthine dehydrogenase accessory factor